MYKVKGSPENPTYKARYVSLGFSQVPGIDYGETFAPTPRMESLRMLIQIAVHKDMIIHQMDVKCTFLNADIEEEVYVRPPKGYERNGYVWKLHMSMNGLKQSGRNWFSLLESYLHEHHFENNVESCLFVLRVPDGHNIAGDISRIIEFR